MEKNNENEFAKYDKALALFKFDIGISHTKRDPYFNALLESANGELLEKGVFIDLEKVNDAMLLSDYAAWRYRNRQENKALAKNLRLRIQNRKIANRCKDG